MDDTNLTTLIKKHVILFLILYELIWLAPSIIVYPIDFISEAITGIKYVDGWSHGMMAWTGSIIITPVVFIILLVTSYTSNRKKNK